MGINLPNDAHNHYKIPLSGIIHANNIRFSIVTIR
jgi:hypothetical protein